MTVSDYVKSNGANNDEEEYQSSLISRNITIFGRRTSVRLEPEMWTSLREIAKREDCSIHDICSLISYRKGKKTSLTAAIRVFLMLYYRAASTEQGHMRAGHGSFDSMKRRAGIADISIDSGRQESSDVKRVSSAVA